MKPKVCATPGSSVGVARTVKHRERAAGDIPIPHHTVVVRRLLGRTPAPRHGGWCISHIPAPVCAKCACTRASGVHAVRQSPSSLDSGEYLALKLFKSPKAYSSMMLTRPYSSRREFCNGVTGDAHIESGNPNRPRDHAQHISMRPQTC